MERAAVSVKAQAYHISAIMAGAFTSHFVFPAFLQYGGVSSA